MSAYVSIRQHTPASLSAAAGQLLQHSPAAAAAAARACPSIFREACQLGGELGSAHDSAAATQTGWRAPPPGPTHVSLYASYMSSHTEVV